MPHPPPSRAWRVTPAAEAMPPDGDSTGCRTSRGKYTKGSVMLNKRVYLAGPIFGKTDDECVAWRKDAAEWLRLHGFEPVDPMARDYRGQEYLNADDIVCADKDDIESCGTVLANANEPSWGTAMELMYAVSFGKRVIAFATHSKCDRISPWVRCHTHAIYESLDAALAGICEDSTAGLRI